MGFMVTSQTTLALRQPLGKWREESPRTLWQYHAMSDRLYFQHSQGTTEYHRIRGISGRSINRVFVQAGEIDEGPSDTADTMIWKKSNTTYMSGHQDHEQSVTSMRYGTFEQYLEAQQQYTWLF
jgi:hypothetical protein